MWPILSGKSSYFSCLCVALVAALVLGCVTKGDLQIGRPDVRNSEATLKHLKAAGGRISVEARKGKLGIVQEGFGVRELISAKASIAVKPPLPGQAPTPPAIPTPLSTVTPALPTAPSTEGFGRTIEEQVNDLIGRERQAVDVELLYTGDGSSDVLGRNARVYLVRFEIGVFPNRQPYWAYPILALRSGFGSVYNFTKGWFAQASFWLPADSDADADTQQIPLVFVYDVWSYPTSVDS